MKTYTTASFRGILFIPGKRGFSAEPFSKGGKISLTRRKHANHVIGGHRAIRPTLKKMGGPELL